jgi:hypothetical protein
MAYYFIFPEKDTTIYSHPDRDTLNTGNDEILELVKEKGSNNSLYYPSRILLQFKNTDIQTAINKSNNFTASLQLFSVDHKNLSNEQSVEVFPISQSWNEGTGKYSNLPLSSNGSSWVYRDNSITQTKWLTSSFAAGTTGSIGNTSITQGGGVWYTGSAFKGSQSFSNADLLDLNIDVTSIVQKFSASLYASQTYPNGITNYGFVVKNSDSIEGDVSSSNGELQYFSVDTHTIYPPKLVFKYDDSIISGFASSGGTISHPTANSSSEHINVSFTNNNKKEYNKDEESTFRLHVRKKYPDRKFTSGSNFYGDLRTGFLKETSYYSIRDAHTEEIIIPFDDNCTKLSSDDDGMYFKLHMNGFQPERHYRILIKHINDHGTTIYDNNYHFKVVR